jgi:hypothetical protein
VLVINRVFLSGRVRAEHSKPYSKRGALLYCVWWSQGVDATLTRELYPQVFQWLNFFASIDSRKILPCLGLIEYSTKGQVLLKTAIGSAD